jgi:5-formyltetrahydrofolate cyclo-ligase
MDTCSELLPPTFDRSAHRARMRQHGLLTREALSTAEHALLSARVAQHLRAELARHKPRRIGFCWPYRAEFDARPVIEQLIEQGWQACLPVVGEDIGPMHFCTWTPATPMYKDKHGIATPQQGETVEPDILLLPFNASDARGYRLGYGAGYFDRTLAAMHPRPFIIGVGFSSGIVASIHPQCHDIPMHCRVTETGLCRF